MDGLIEGRIVHYVAPSGKHYPAMVVRKWDGDTVNLQVFLDGTNVLFDDGAHFSREEADAGRAWRTSMRYAEVSEGGGTPYTWHWIERA